MAACMSVVAVVATVANVVVAMVAAETRTAVSNSLQ